MLAPDRRRSEGGAGMKIVIWKSPKFFSGILKLLFRIH